MKKTVLEIDLKALEHNFNVISSMTKTKIMAVVKANGYGSNSVEIAKKLESLNVDYFAVAFASEGVVLRKSGVKTPILVLLPQVASFSEIVEYNLEPSLYSFYFLYKKRRIIVRLSQYDISQNNYFKAALVISCVHAPEGFFVITGSDAPDIRTFTVLS